MQQVWPIDFHIKGQGRGRPCPWESFSSLRFPLQLFPGEVTADAWFRPLSNLDFNAEGRPLLLFLPIRSTGSLLRVHQRRNQQTKGAHTSHTYYLGLFVYWLTGQDSNLNGLIPATRRSHYHCCDGSRILNSLLKIHHSLLIEINFIRCRLCLCLKINLLSQ